MVSRGLACAAIALASFTAASPAIAGPRALLELFTSQGCSSCPAADKLLGELVAADPALIAISFSIDVWDYLGWKDTLADPRNTARWQAYSKSRGDHNRYTPQVVINGTGHAVGSDKAAIEKAIGKSRQNTAVMSVEVKATRSGESLVIALPQGAPAAPAEVMVWSLARTATVMITRGENKGRTVTYHNVVRRSLPLGAWTTTANQWSVPLRDIGGDGIEAAAVMLQSGTPQMPGFVLGAAMASIR